MNAKRIAGLLRALESVSSTATAANPYLSTACVNNLTRYLHSLCKEPYSGHLLIGEAPGYKGCALTGIPFTSQNVLTSSSHPFIVKLRPSLAVTGTTSEATATIVWSYLEGCHAVPAMWNVFPFHPHRKHCRESNRTPTKVETDCGKPFLQRVLDILCPDSVIAVGGTAAKTLARLFPTMKFVTVRHPSYGGKTEFMSGLKKARIQ
ncbi:MAG: uracil-DNA glycosylase [Pirellulales bacterium]|nr:uracil-DNA glycosylase [Pirellulales bacterium]